MYIREENVDEDDEDISANERRIFGESDSQFLRARSQANGGVGRR